MIEPVFPNDDPVALHQAALIWNDDSVEPADLLALAAHPRLARGTLLILYWRAAAVARPPGCSRSDAPAKPRMWQTV